MPTELRLGEDLWVLDGEVVAPFVKRGGQPLPGFIPGVAILRAGTRILVLHRAEDPEAMQALADLEALGLRVQAACRLRRDHGDRLLYWALAADGSAEVGTLELGTLRRAVWEGLSPALAEAHYLRERRWWGSRTVEVR